MRLQCCIKNVFLLINLSHREKGINEMRERESEKKTTTTTVGIVFIGWLVGKTVSIATAKESTPIQCDSNLD